MGIRAACWSSLSWKDQLIVNCLHFVLDGVSFPNSAFEQLPPRAGLANRGLLAFDHDAVEDHSVWFSHEFGTLCNAYGVELHLGVQLACFWLVLCNQFSLQAPLRLLLSGVT